MPCCVVSFCKNYSGKSNKSCGITFHRFPQDKLRVQKWVEFVRLERRDQFWQPNDSSRICSDHFAKEMFFITKNGLRKLNKNTVPNLQVIQSQNNEIATDSDIDETALTRIKDPGASTSKAPEEVVEAAYGDDAELNSDDDMSDDEADQTPFRTSQKSQSGQQGHNFGIKCSNCQSDIIGFRYTCVQCAGVELCVACEARQAHATHYVLRIPPTRPHTEVVVVLSRVREAVVQAQAAGRVLLSTESQIQEPEIRIISQEIKQEVKEEDPLQEEANQPKMNILEQALLDIPLVKEECIDPEETSEAVVPKTVPVVEVPMSPLPPPPAAKRRRAEPPEPPEPRASHSGPQRAPDAEQKPVVTSQSGFTVFTHTHARGTQAQHTRRTTTDPPKTSKANTKKS